MINVHILDNVKILSIVHVHANNRACNLYLNICSYDEFTLYIFKTLFFQSPSLLKGLKNCTSMRIIINYQNKFMQNYVKSQYCVKFKKKVGQIN